MPLAVNQRSKEVEDMAVGDLRRMFLLDEKTGVLRWAVRPSQGTKVGDVAGSVEARTGYVRVRVGGRKVMAHRVVWAMVHGEWPKHDIDHRDLVRNNNRPDNLRAATRSQNMANRPALVTNALGLKGVYHNRRIGKYHAQIRASGRRVHLGFFDSADEAYAAYVSAAARVHGEFAFAGSVS